MRIQRSRLTSKGQMTVPKEARRALGIHPGDEVEIDIVRSFLVVRPRPKFKDPLAVLCGQVKADIDMTKEIRKLREEAS